MAASKDFRTAARKSALLLRFEQELCGARKGLPPIREAAMWPFLRYTTDSVLIRGRCIFVNSVFPCSETLASLQAFCRVRGSPSAELVCVCVAAVEQVLRPVLASPLGRPRQAGGGSEPLGASSIPPGAKSCIPAACSCQSPASSALRWEMLSSARRLWGCGAWGEAGEASPHPGRVLEQSSPAASTGVTAAVLLPSVGEQQEGSDRKPVRSSHPAWRWGACCQDLTEGLGQTCPWGRSQRAVRILGLQACYDTGAI